MRVVLNLFQLVLISLLLIGCGGGGGGQDSEPSQTVTPTPNPTPNPAPSPNPSGPAATITITDSLGLISGGTGLVQGTGAVGTQLVGVSGTGLAVGVSGTGVAWGTIQAFGSVIINDQRIDTALADFEIEGSLGQQSDLRQGQQVLVVGDIDAEQASKVTYRANIIGPLETVLVKDAILELGSARSLGQDIVLNAATVYEDTELTLLGINQVVEISGIMGDNGVLTATFIRDATSSPTYKVIGEASAVSNSSLQLQGLTVGYQNQQLVDFDKGAIVDGDVVEVIIDPATVGINTTTVTAQSVELLQRLIVGDSASVRAEGIVDTFNSESSFTVQSQPVATNSSTAFFNGSSAQLVLGSRVLAIGAADATGTLVAAELYFESDDTVVAEGPIESIDLVAKTIGALSVTFEIRDLTDFDEIDGLEDLQIGDIVEIAGYIDGQAIVASDIELEDPGETEAELRGPATAFDATAGSLSIFDVDIQTTSGATTYEDFNEQPISQSAFFDLLSNQLFVSVEWQPFSSTADIPSKVSLEDD